MRALFRNKLRVGSVPCVLPRVAACANVRACAMYICTCAHSFLCTCTRMCVRLCSCVIVCVHDCYVCVCVVFFVCVYKNVGLPKGVLGTPYELVLQCLTTGATLIQSPCLETTPRRI